MSAPVSTATGACVQASGVSVSYRNDIAVVQDVDLRVDRGEIVAIVGPNGAGKTTLLKALSGLLPVKSGTVSFLGEDVTGRSTARRVKQGMSLVPQGHETYPGLSVRDNLVAGAYSVRRSVDVPKQLDEVYALFPRLGERAKQRAGSLSGGERAMLAIGRSMMCRPKAMLIDEISQGLAPAIREVVFEGLAAQRDRGLTVLFAEQDIPLALKYATRVYVLIAGEFVRHYEVGANESSALAKTIVGEYFGSAGLVTEQAADGDRE
jgi:branched-chain amino acid transport system ATP-binding protein